MNVNFVKIMYFIENRVKKCNCYVEYGFLPKDGEICVDIFKWDEKLDGTTGMGFYINEASELFEDIKSECKQFINDIKLIDPSHNCKIFNHLEIHIVPLEE